MNIHKILRGKSVATGFLLLACTIVQISLRTAGVVGLLRADQLCDEVRPLAGVSLPL